MCKVSVIVPVYNVERYLKKCIDSIVEQTLTDLEIILVNDGSTDNCGRICDEYVKKDSRIKVIHKNNGGLSSARNAGLDIAQGEYIAFVDSDDFVSSDMFESLFNLAEKSNADIAIAKYVRFSNEQDLLKFKALDKETIKQFTNIEALYNYFQNKLDNDKEVLTVVWDKIYKKNLFSDIQFPVGKIYEDGYVTYKLLYMANKIVHTDKVLYYYYQRSDSITNSNYTINEKVLNSYDDCREIFNFIYENVNSLSYLVAERYLQKYFSTFNEIDLSQNPNFEIYKEKIKKDLREDFKKIISCKITKNNKIQLILFLVNYNLFKLYRRIIKNVRRFKGYI